MKITRIWAMPNKWTFKIKPIKELLDRYVKDGTDWIDPFAGENSPAEYTNDLNPKMPTQYHMKALDYVRTFDKTTFKGILFDPPYSGRQVKECYNNLKIDIQRDDTNAFFYWSIKKEIASNIEAGGYAISFGWNSNGFGQKLGFTIIEILLVAHGSSHNDTIVTVERKINKKLTGGNFTQPLSEVALRV